MSIPRACEDGSFDAGGPASAELSVSGSSAARALLLAWVPRGPTRYRDPTRGLRLQPRRSGHRCFLGRTVVLTIGRLVASNPSFASVRAPAHRHPTKTAARCMHDSTAA